MNHLQRLQADRDFCVTLNRTEAIDPAKVIRTISYSHPVYTPAAVAAQSAHASISGLAARTHYCGAYWGWGFHEDGVRQRAARVRAVRGDAVRHERWASCLYEGSVRHRRHGAGARRVALPAVHGLPRPRRAAAAVRRAPGCGRRGGRPLAWFRRADHLGDPRTPLADAVARARVPSGPARAPRGRSALLTHLRYFGYCFNPVSFYYCYDAEPASTSRRRRIAARDEHPWGESHPYVMAVEHVADRGTVGARCAGEFEKRLHVSPLMGMEHTYDWRADRAPRSGCRCTSSRGSATAASAMFDATLSLRRREISARDAAPGARCAIRF